MFKENDNQKIIPIDPSVPLEKILIKSGRIIDPANGIDKIADIAIVNGEISDVGTISSDFKADREIDASGLWVTPGLVDIHVHLREPGREDKETIETGTMAAAAGGFTAVACMPNTNPVLDEESKIRYVIKRGKNCSARIYPIGAITKNLEGESLTPFNEMIEAGAKGVSDDGRTVYKANVMRNALNYSKSFSVPVMSHCEDIDLVDGGHMNESEISTKLGVKGIPTIAEEVIISRDIMLAEYTGAKLHICHVSSLGGVEIIRQAKKRGVSVTAETCPHYFAFTDEELLTYNTHKKMNPPLRGKKDRAAIIESLVDGTLDAIVSDHAPHTAEEKDVEFNAAAFGVVGLETQLGASIKYLVKSGKLTPSQLVEKMSVAPNRVLSTSGGSLSVGAVADVTIIDPDAEWVVDPSFFFSKGRNSAFEGEKLTGYAVTTILGGRVVYIRER